MTKNAGIILFIAVLSVIASGIFILNKQKQKISSPPPGESTISITPEAAATGTSEVTMVKEVSEITLSVTTPLSGTSVATSKVTMKGKTAPKAEVFANEAEGVADSSGNFSLTVALDEGENSIIVTAVDENGNVAEKEILVTYSVAE